MKHNQWLLLEAMLVRFYRLLTLAQEPFLEDAKNGVRCVRFRNNAVSLPCTASKFGSHSPENRDNFRLIQQHISHPAFLFLGFGWRS